MKTFLFLVLIFGCFGFGQGVKLKEEPSLLLPSPVIAIPVSPSLNNIVFQETSGTTIVRVTPDGKVLLAPGITAEQAIVKIAKTLERDLPAQAKAMEDCMDGWKRSLDRLAPTKK